MVSVQNSDSTWELEGYFRSYRDNFGSPKALETAP
jgi:hypothetical protein